MAMVVVPPSEQEPLTRNSFPALNLTDAIVTVSVGEAVPDRELAGPSNPLSPIAMTVQ
jgi:hypothetical protein